MWIIAAACVHFCHFYITWVYGASCGSSDAKNLRKSCVENLLQPGNPANHAALFKKSFQ